VSYDLLVAEAVAFYPLQESSGDAIDIIAGADLAPAGPVVYGVPGPSAWLPLGVGVGVLDEVFRQFLREGATFLDGLVAYTVAFWFRGESAGVMIPVVTAAPEAKPSCGVFNHLSYVVNDGSTAGLSTVSVTPGPWHFLSYRRDASGLGRRLGADDYFESGVTEADPFAVCIFRVGPFGAPHEMAGLGVWGRELSDEELVVLQAGPIAPIVLPGLRRKRRGSGGVKAPGRR